jgi:hypothetical protein
LHNGQSVLPTKRLDLLEFRGIGPLSLLDFGAWTPIMKGAGRREVFHIRDFLSVRSAPKNERHRDLCVCAGRIEFLVISRVHVLRALD